MPSLNQQQFLRSGCLHHLLRLTVHEITSKLLNQLRVIYSTSSHSELHLRSKTKSKYNPLWAHLTDVVPACTGLLTHSIQLLFLNLAENWHTFCASSCGPFRQQPSTTSHSLHKQLSMTLQCINMINSRDDSLKF